MKKLSLEIDGRVVEGRAAYAKGAVWVHLDGETFVVEAGGETRTRRGGVAKSTHAGEIAAPMPGKIIKVMANAGETVSEGQVLVVMEAMKMEYTLKAQSSGQVLEILTGEGDQVALGQILMKLEPASESAQGEIVK